MDRIVELPDSLRDESSWKEVVTVPDSAGEIGSTAPLRIIPGKSLSKLTKIKSATELAFNWL